MMVRLFASSGMKAMTTKRGSGGAAAGLKILAIPPSFSPCRLTTDRPLMVM